MPFFINHMIDCHLVERTPEGSRNSGRLHFTKSKISTLEHVEELDLKLRSDQRLHFLRCLVKLMSRSTSELSFYRLSQRESAWMAAD